MKDDWVDYARDLKRRLLFTPCLWPFMQGVTVANEGVHSVPCSRNNTFDKDTCPVSPTARVS